MDENNNCIFCKIVRGELPCTKVAENEEFMAFLDIRPLSPGHTLVIPKRHYRWVWDVPNTGKYFEFATKIANAQKKAFGVELVAATIMGEEIPHAHIWLVPDKENTKGDKMDFSANAEKIKSNL